MDQFVVPQFIDAEDKIIGPLTARQFVELLVTGLMMFTLFKLLPFVWFLLVGLPLFALGIVLTFVKVNGQPFHMFLLNLIQSLKKPKLRVWDKRLTDAEVRVYLEAAPVAPPPPMLRKAAVPSSRLQELTLVVNTGGVYKPEED